MAFLRNDAINRVNLHTGIEALAQSGGGVFLLVYLIRAGISVPLTLCTMAAILTARFALRPLILPLARHWGLKPLLIAGTIAMAAPYPLLAEVRGVGGALALLCLAGAVGGIFYWPAYNAYFAALGDAEHRGQQIAAREALVAGAAIVAPLLGAWALVAMGPRWMFACVGMVQALSALPLFGMPNVAVARTAPGALRAAALGTALGAADGWFDACFLYAWQIALFVTLGESFAAYGGAMALAGLFGALFGMVLGRHVDAGHGRRAVAIAYSGMAAIVVLRSMSLGSPWLAVGANAFGALLGSLMLPASTASYNLAKASPCPMRFQLAAEAGWDLGCVCALLIAAGLAAEGVPLARILLVGLPPLAVAAPLLRRYYGARHAAL